MTTLIQQAAIEQLRISSLRPKGSIPSASPVDIERAQLHGLSILADIKVRPRDDHGYDIIEGLVTWRAAQYLQIGSVDIQVLDIDDDLASELIAHDFAACRHRKNPLIEAESILALAYSENTTPGKIGRRLNMDKREVSDCIRLLKLPSEIKQPIASGQLTLGKAKMLVTLEHNQQITLAERILKERWSTRRIENEVRTLKHGSQSTKPPPPLPEKPEPNAPDKETEKEQNRLTECIGSQVEIHHDAQTGQGRIIIDYANLDVYEGIAERLSQTPSAPALEDDWNF